MVDVLIRWWESFCKVYIDQIIMTYALNIWQFYCQLYLSKAEKKTMQKKWSMNYFEYFFSVLILSLQNRVYFV